jgi:hypothetical protein
LGAETLCNQLHRAKRVRGPDLRIQDVF